MLNSVIYISGSGRSGSTLLEKIFNSSGNVSSTGEFHCLWRLPLTEMTCSCGVNFSDDAFWKQVLLLAKIDPVDINELRQLEALICRTGFIARHRFSLPALAANPDVQRFLDIQFRLFEAIAKVSDNAFVIDSSKAGPRAWILACDPRVRLVHLYRDPADVIASWRSVKFDPGIGDAMKRMSVLAAALDWWKVEQLVGLLPRTRVAARLDYGALCSSPSEVVGECIARLKIEPQIKPRWLNNNRVQPNEIYHSLNGNPDRFDKSAIDITFRKTKWKQYSRLEGWYIWLLSSVIRRACFVR